MRGSSAPRFFLRLLARIFIPKLILPEYLQEFFSAHLFRVSPDTPQHPKQPRTLAVLRRGHVLEIIGTAIAPVTVNVVDFIALRTFTYPRERNERVAVHAVEMPHNGVLGAADAIGRAPTLAADGRERRLHLMHDASLVGNRHVVYAVELARPTAIERFVGGTSSDDRAVHESELIRIHKTALPLLESANVATHWEKRC